MPSSCTILFVGALLTGLLPATGHGSVDDGSCALSQQQSPFDDLVHATLAGGAAARHPAARAVPPPRNDGWAKVVDRPAAMTVQNGPKCALYALQAVMRFQTPNGEVPKVDRPATLARYTRADEFRNAQLLGFAPPPPETIRRRVERVVAETIDRLGVAVAAFGASDAIFDAARIDGDTVNGGTRASDLVDLAHHYGYRAERVPASAATMDAIRSAIDDGTPVITGFNVDEKGNPCTDGGPVCLGRHAVVIEGYGIARDGTRWVIAKHSWSTKPYVWKESDFERSMQAVGSGLAIIEPKL